MIKLKSLFRRGQQTPSSSSNNKYGPGHGQQQQQPTPSGQLPDSSASAVPPHLKGSSSTSNIDGLGLSKADKKKQQKEFGSRDRLDEKREHRSSKDRLVDNLRGKSKASKEAKKLSKSELPVVDQMSVVQQHQQQQQQLHQPQASVAVGIPSNAAVYEHQRPSLAAYGTIVDEALTRELTEINFDGPHSDAKSIQFHELRLQLERVTAEKKAVEAQLAEMSVFQSEVMALRNEMSKMKVRKFL